MINTDDKLDVFIIRVKFINVTNDRTRLLDYLETLSGERPDLKTVGSSSLPLFLRERYKLFSISLFGRKCLLAMESGNWETGPASEYRSHAAALTKEFAEPVALVLSPMPSSTRNRLVQAGVPFIVPCNQMFLPFLMLDLRERFAPKKSTTRKSLSPTAQLIVLSHLLREPMEHLPLKDIAARLAYSPMMVSKAKDELEATGLSKAQRVGRSVVLEFQAQGLQLWEQAEPLLSSPAQKVQWLWWKEPCYPALRAGLSALSKQTMIEDDRLPTFALEAHTFRANLGKGQYRICSDPEEATVRMEAWRYNPLLLAKDEQTVDPLSLYLSLQDSPDERVQQQLTSLLSSIQW